MALAATTIVEVETTGSDTLNGGMFDPGQTAGMFTDGAATLANTSAPVFTSASYNFVPGDKDAWLYLASGTTGATVAGGWYKIASVALNAATLNGTIGQGVLKSSVTPTTVVGCANGASPTAITWTIDYSQQAAAQFTYTDLASAGAGLTVSSAAKPFAKQQVGNSLVITGGTNFTTGTYVIASVAAGVATVLGAANITTGVGASGTGGQGGALASPGQAAAVKVASNPVHIAGGTYSIASTTANVSGGRISDASASAVSWIGYQSIRGDYGTRPILQVASSGVTSITVLTANSAVGNYIANLEIDGQSKATIRGALISGAALAYRVLVRNCTNTGLVGGTQISCIGTGCTTVAPALGMTVGVGCEAYSNTVAGMVLTANNAALAYCLSYNNSGASSDGFTLNTVNALCVSNCVAYGNGRDGYRLADANVCLNCIAEANTGLGFGGGGSSRPRAMLLTCAGFSNTGGNLDSTNLIGSVVSVLAGGSSFFTNAAAGDFSLNTTAGAGALLRAAGYPGLFPAGLTRGYLDIGAAQHADPTSIQYRPSLSGNV